MDLRAFAAVAVALLIAGGAGALWLLREDAGGPGGAGAEVSDAAAPEPEAVPRVRVTAPKPEPEPAPPEPAPSKQPVPEPEAPPPPPAPPEPPAEPADLVLEMVAPPEEQERRILVTVRDRELEPIDDVLVVVREEESILYRARTDAGGRVEFRPWPSEKGPFRIDAVAFGYETASAASVAPGAGIELMLVTRPAVEGVLRAPALQKAVVRLYTADGNVLSARPAADGSFLFEDLEQGPATLQAVVEPFGSDEQRLLLEPGVLQRVRLRIRRRDRVRIYGRVRLWPGEGKVLINGLPADITRSGSYEFTEAVVGLNEIVADAEGRALYRDRFEVRATSKSRYDFALHREATIRGRVRDARRRLPVAGAEVRVGVDFSNPRNRELSTLFPVELVPVVRTDREGRFEIPKLDRRLIYLVSVVAHGHGQFLGQALAGGGPFNPTLPEGPFLFGKLRGYGGVPRDAVVTATPLERVPPELRFNADGWNRSRSLRDREGLYGLSGLLPGNYLLRIDAPGYGSLETVIGLAEGQRSRLDLRLRRGEFANGEDAELLDRLPPAIRARDGNEPPAPADTTILLIDARRPADRPPFPGVRIRFFADDEELSPPMLFDGPDIELLGLPEADYRAVLTHPDLKRPRVYDAIVLRRGRPVTLELR